MTVSWTSTSIFIGTTAERASMWFHRMNCSLDYSKRGFGRETSKCSPSLRGVAQNGEDQ